MKSLTQLMMLRKGTILLVAVTLLRVEAQDASSTALAGAGSDTTQTGGMFQIPISLDLPLSTVSIPTDFGIEASSTIAETGSAGATAASGLSVSLDLPASISSIITTYSVGVTSTIPDTLSAITSLPTSSSVSSSATAVSATSQLVPSTSSSSSLTSVPSSSVILPIASSSVTSSIATSSSSSVIQSTTSAAPISSSLRPSSTSSSSPTSSATQLADTTTQPSRYLTSSFSNADRAQYDRLVVAHAAIGSIAWLITSPLIMLFTLWPRKASAASDPSRLRRGWYDLLQTSTTGVFTLVSVIVGAVATGMASSSHFSSVHGQLSIVLLALLALQIIISRIIAWRSRGSSVPTRSNSFGIVLHVLISFVLSALGFAAIYTGFTLYDTTARKSTPLSVIVIWAVLVGLSSLALLAVVALLVTRRHKNAASRRGSRNSLDRSTSGSTAVGTARKEVEKGATAAAQSATNPFEQVSSASADSLPATAESSTRSPATVAATTAALTVPSSAAITHRDSYHSAMSWHTGQAEGGRRETNPFTQADDIHPHSDTSASSTDDLGDPPEVQVISVPRTLPGYSAIGSASTPAFSRTSLSGPSSNAGVAASQIPVRKRRSSNEHQQVKRKAVPQYLV